MNTCRVCKLEKPSERFELIYHSGNRRKICRECTNARVRAVRSVDPTWPERRRNIVLRNKYGIEPVDYDRMLDKQGGACAICRRAVEYNLHVDHCHDSLKVRGLLCRPCNTAIGLLDDNTTYLRQAIDYLEGGE